MSWRYELQNAPNGSPIWDLYNILRCHSLKTSFTKFIHCKVGKLVIFDHLASTTDFPSSQAFAAAPKTTYALMHAGGIEVDQVGGIINIVIGRPKISCTSMPIVFIISSLLSKFSLSLVPRRIYLLKAELLTAQSKHGGVLFFPWRNIICKLFAIRR